MPRYKEQKILPYTPKQLFDLVADVESYPNFLPWCIHVKKLSKEKNGFIAEMKVGNRLFSESFVSKDVLFSPRLNMPGKIQVFYKRGPFDYLNNHWTFSNYRKNSCKLEFFIDFEIRKGILRDLFSDFFFSVAKKLTLAFEKRAEDLYSKV